MVLVNVKWGKQTFSGVDLDLTEPLEVFKSQIYALTNVPVDRQKIIIKGSRLKDDQDLSTLPIKPNQVVMLMGTADALPQEPVERPVFEEDLSADQKTQLTQSGPVGLTNLGNTCYMNSSLQCLRYVNDLRRELSAMPLGSSNGGSLEAALPPLLSQLFGQLDSSGQAVTPLEFVFLFRQAFPQFAQQNERGAFMQQDADECWIQLMYCLQQHLPHDSSKGPGETGIHQIFGGELESTLTNTETDQEPPVVSRESFLKVKCFISGQTNFLHEGLLAGLEESIEKNSSVLGRSCVYQKQMKISRLPKYLTLQFVRFLWRRDTNQKAKILRRVKYPLKLDMQDYCTDSLKQKMAPHRLRLREIEEKELAESKRQKNSAAANAGAPSSTETAPAAASASEEKMQVDQTAGAGADSGNSDMAEVSTDDPDLFYNKTGMYRLSAVVTHKGRSADSGHYVGWVRNPKNKEQWFKFDDDQVSTVTTEEVLDLSGGGDWHMAYICIYETIM